MVLVVAPHQIDLFFFFCVRNDLFFWPLVYFYVSEAELSVIVPSAIGQIQNQPTRFFLEKQKQIQTFC